MIRDICYMLMRSMLKKSLIFFIIVVMGISLFHVISVSAQEVVGARVGGLDSAAKKGGLYKEGDAETLLAQEVGKYINLALGFVGVVLLIIVIYGGMIWLTAGGKPEKVDSAKKNIISACIGLGVTLLADQGKRFVIAKIG